MRIILLYKANDNHYHYRRGNNYEKTFLWNSNFCWTYF